MSTIPELLKSARESMDKAVENTKRELSTVRSGKATTSLLDLVRVDAYGSIMPLNQVGLVSAPEPRMLTVQPFDKSMAPAIEKAIREADLGLNPAAQGDIIRVPLPVLTEERRKELVRLVHKLAEEGKVAIRHARGDIIHKIKKLEHVSDDDKKRAEKDVQKLTDGHVHTIDELITAKEAEIMEV
jgi:ribosome recycling factor